MKLGYGFLLIIAVAGPVANADVNTNRYSLPSSKRYIEACGREALFLHPGVVEKQRVLHNHGDFWVRYEIQASDGPEWLVLCDLADGSVIREQKLVDDAF